MTSIAKWDEHITEFYHKNHHHRQSLPLSHYFLGVLCHRLGLQTLLHESDDLRCLAEENFKEEKLSLDHVPLPDINEVETLYQTYMGRGVRTGSGSFYTPDQLAAFMVKESLRTHYHNQVSRKALPYFPLDDQWMKPDVNKNSVVPEDVRDEMVKWYQSLHVLDLSCGSGVFLRQALNLLVKAGIFIFNTNGNRIETMDLIRECAEEKITGVEFRQDTKLLAEILLRLQVQDMHEVLGMKLTNLSEIRLNLHCHNALFWNAQVKEGNGHERYTLILGNPPYIGEKGNTTLFNETKASAFGTRHYEKNMDFSYYFLHKGLDLLAKEGVLCYITTSYFATADGGKKLRQRLQEEVLFHWLVYPENITLFSHAKGQHNLIYCLSRKDSHYKSKPILIHVVETTAAYEFLNSLPVFDPSVVAHDPRATVFDDASQLFDQRGQLLIRSPGLVKPIIDKICQKSMYQLQDLCTVNQGVVSGADKLTKQHKKVVGFYEEDRGIFVLNQQEKEALVKQEPSVDRFLKPFYKNSQIRSYGVAGHTNQWLLYLTDDNMPTIDWSEPLNQHLAPFKALLSQRREVKMGIRRWHSLHWPRNPNIFEKEKIVAPQRSALNIFGYSTKPWYASADVYFIQRRETCFYSTEYLLLWLNSALCYAWLSYYGKMKGKDLELYATPLKQIPVPGPPSVLEEKWMQDQFRRIISAQGDAGAYFQLVNEVDHRFLSWVEVESRQCRELLTQVNTLRKKMLQKDRR